jgi:hypothetical protein
MPINPKLQLQGACAKCDCMWREYAHAMAEHLKVQLDLYMAATTRNSDRESSLNESLLAAESRRNNARKILRAHEDVKHTVALG